MSKGAVMWFCKSDWDGTWDRFDGRLTEECEKYGCGSQMLVKYVWPLPEEKFVPYTVDLFEMQQTNHFTGRVRNVLCVSLSEEPAETMTDYLDIVWLVKINGRDRWVGLDESIQSVLEDMIDKKHLEVYHYEGGCHSYYYYTVYDQGQLQWVQENQFTKTVRPMIRGVKVQAP